MIALLLVLLFSQPVSALSEAELRESIRNLVDLREPPPDEPALWKGFGTAAVPVIISLYESEDRIHQRQRLLQGLAWTNDDRAAEFLKDQAAHTSERSLRNAALQTLAVSQGEAAVPALAEYLKHQDDRTRFAAASALEGLSARSADARDRLAEYEKTEKAPWILEKLKRRRGLKIAEPAKLEPLSPSGANESPLRDTLKGAWSGQWLVPSEKLQEWKRFATPASKRVAPPKAELMALEGRFLLSWTPEARLRGVGALAVDTPAAPGTPSAANLSIEDGVSKGDGVSGTLVLTTPAGKAEKFSFTLNWRTREGVSMIDLEIPRLASRLVARKSPETK